MKNEEFELVFFALEEKHKAKNVIFILHSTFFIFSLSRNTKTVLQFGDDVGKVTVFLHSFIDYLYGMEHCGVVSAAHTAPDA